MDAPEIIVVGGGAAGFFAAITCAETNSAARVTLYEATAHPLAKVRISGGGRCNVTHACFDLPELIKRYPRGARELLGPFHHWGPRETMAWFAGHGVTLKTEADGRVFPDTDDSATVVDCLKRSALQLGVQVVTTCAVREASGPDTGFLDEPDQGNKRFRLRLANGETAGCDRLLIATGGGKDAGGMALAERLGHTIEPPVPSLFTFHIEDVRLRGLEGLSVGHVVTRVLGTKLRESGPLLITHWGLSGPAILKLSAWGARDLHAANYRCTLGLNWVAPRSAEDAKSELAAYRAANPRRQLSTGNPFALPARLWERLLVAAGLVPASLWSGISNTMLQALAVQLTEAEFAVAGKSLNKEEFVTCGGVRLNEVDFRTMESRVCPGLYFAGEVLDIDGITGGFNFQSAWTTGRLAGLALAQPSPGPDA